MRLIKTHNPLYPPYLKGNIERKTFNFKRERVRKTELLLIDRPGKITSALRYSLQGENKGEGTGKS
jgi:hypothetical protein